MPHIPPAVSALERDLRAIFGARFESLVVYGALARGESGPVHTIAVVASVGADDLNRCAHHAAGWHDAGLATPLVLGAHEFERSLDAFPFEFGAIVADHVVAAGRDPFAGVTVDAADLRRACELQARSHLLHLREGYIETRGRSDAVAELVVRSGTAFAALLKSLERLGGTPPPVLPSKVAALAGTTRISPADATEIFPAYLDAVDQIVRYVDRWSATR